MSLMNFKVTYVNDNIIIIITMDVTHKNLKLKTLIAEVGAK